MNHQKIQSSLQLSNISPCSIMTILPLLGKKNLLFGFTVQKLVLIGTVDCQLRNINNLGVTLESTSTSFRKIIYMVSLQQV